MSSAISPRDALHQAWAWRKVAACLTTAYAIRYLLRFAAIIHRVPTWKPDH